MNEAGLDTFTAPPPTDRTSTMSVERRAGWNLLVLVFIVLPAWIALMFVAASIFPVTWVSEEGFVRTGGQLAGALLFWWLIMVIPVALGGLVHQFIVALLPEEWPARRLRASAVLATPVVPLMLAIPAPQVMLGPRVLGPTLVAILGYGLIVRLPADPAAAENAR